MRVTVQQGIILLTAFLFSGCGLFGDEQEPQDFGFEEGYFYWYQEEKIPLKRDRNHLSIRFYEEYGKAHHDSVLKAHDIKIVWSQTFGKEVPLPGRYRVVNKPAEAYYTTYGDGDTTLNHLGNLPEVEYVLPAYYDDEPEDEKLRERRLTPTILFSMHDHYSEERKKEILDSLKQADGVDLRQLFPGEDWSSFNFYVTKVARTNPYKLYHHYYTLPFFRSLSMDLAQTGILFDNHQSKH